ncbi:hypothetical protein F5887DRAFT_955634 [Amanita rubescens]|nr:hypothetical protein F5887DRAFT_955634 [Amanita rubescens]
MCSGKECYIYPLPIPYRSVQIVLRLYHSPAEILVGFNIDALCCAYDGARVWANPRAIITIMRQCNTTDVTRRSPSYEVRLSKYADIRTFDCEGRRIGKALGARAISYV